MAKSPCATCPKTKLKCNLKPKAILECDLESKAISKCDLESKAIFKSDLKSKIIQSYIGIRLNIRNLCVIALWPEPFKYYILAPNFLIIALRSLATWSPSYPKISFMPLDNGFITLIPHKFSKIHLCPIFFRNCTFSQAQQL